MFKTFLFCSFSILSQCFLNSPLYGSTNSLTDFNNQITQSQFLNAVVYYNSNNECDDDCISAEKILLQFSDEFEGIIEFSKSDCNILKQKSQLEHFPICGYQEKLPALTFYKPPQQKYNQALEKQFPEEFYYGRPTNFASLKEFTKGQIPSYRTLISNQHELQLFLEYYDLPHKVLLFTDARETSTMFKGLSAQYKDQLDFGEIRIIKKEQQSLAKQFNVSSFPSLVVVEVGPHGKVKEIHNFEEKQTFQNVMKFLKKFARTNKITNPNDQIKTLYPQINQISVQNFTDIVIQSPDVIFVHFAIDDEQHYAWKELITKLGIMFQYYEMNCTKEENFEFISTYSKQNKEYFPLIGYFPKGEKNISESNQGFFLNFHKPNDIFHDLAVIMSNQTQSFGASNAKEFLYQALEEKQKPYLILFPSSVYSNEILLFKSLSIQHRLQEKLNFAIYFGDFEPLKKALHLTTVPTMISLFGQSDDKDQKIGYFKLPFNIQNMLLYCDDMIERFYKFKFVQNSLTEINSQEIYDLQCKEDGEYCYIAFLDGRQRQEQENKMKDNEISEKLDLLFNVQSIFKNKNKQISINWIDGYCYLEILSIFDLTMHQLPFIVAINAKKEKYQIMKKGFNIENIEDFILKIRRNKGKFKTLPMIDIDTKHCEKIKPKGYEKQEL